jgi:hypothetical protein
LEYQVEKAHFEEMMPIIKEDYWAIWEDVEKRVREYGQ